MYNEMTTAELIIDAFEKAYPKDNPSSENAELICALADRLKDIQIKKNSLVAFIEKHFKPLEEVEDGYDEAMKLLST